MTRFRCRAAAIAVTSLCWAAAPGLALAQEGVPDHVPGTICFTPSFWCWAQQPGFAGQPCGCATADGFVPGTLG